MSNVTAIIVAAGEGKRFGSAKQYAALRGKSLLDRCLEIFNNHAGILDIILVLRETEQRPDLFERYAKLRSVSKGGERRQDSVWSGFQDIDPERTDFVLIHDAARPLVSVELIDRIIETAKARGAAIPVLPVRDTVKKINGDRVLRTLDRKGLCFVQTPQGFSREVLGRAFEEAKNYSWTYTDEAALVEKMGVDVFIVSGDPKNIKITVPEDLELAEALFED